MDLDLMPGFTLTWNYNKLKEPEAKYSNDTVTKQFVRSGIPLNKGSYLTLIFRLVNMLDNV